MKADLNEALRSFFSEAAGKLIYQVVNLVGVYHAGFQKHGGREAEVDSQRVGFRCKKYG